MTLEQYYEILKELWEQTDKNSLTAICNYNAFKRELRRYIDKGGCCYEKPVESVHGEAVAERFLVGLVR